jgi:hypothetical protein
VQILKSREISFQIILAILGVLAASVVLLKHIHSVPFIDETYVVAAAKNLILEHNYSTPEFPVFSSLISTGFWSAYPSGIAAALGASKSAIRSTAFYFCCLMLLLSLRFALEQLRMSRFEKNTWPFIFLGVFFTYIPYPESAVMSLGEIPSCAYLLIGLVLLMRKNIYPGFCLLGVSVFGGKMVNSAFVVPLIVLFTFAPLTLAPQKMTLKEQLKPLAGFLTPFFIWILIIALCAGPQIALQWITDFFGNLGSFSKLASGMSATPVTQHVPFLSRFSNPDLEWVHYPLLMKLKIIFLLLAPSIITFWLRQKEIKKGLSKWIFQNPLLSGLLVGQWIFTIWYFGIHPKMWIRHLQPALIVGMGLLGMYAFCYYLNNKKPKVTLTLQLLLLCFFSLRFIQFVMKAGAN